MSLPDSTIENLVIALRLSNKPNIIVEGKDDEIIYGRLVERLGRFGIGLFSAGSKNTLLHLYEELSQYESLGDFRHVPVAFIADRDMWLFSGIPEGYADIIWTQGCGKLLFQILLRFLNAADRELRFQTTHHGLFAIALDRPVSSQLFDRLIQEVERKLSDQKQRLTQ